MRDSKKHLLEVLPSAMGNIARLAYAVAEEKGVNVDVLLHRAGLSRKQIDDVDARVEVGRQIVFLDLVAKAVGDDLLGFHLGQRFDLRQLGFLYYVLASSDTLGEALQRGSRYTTIVNEGVKISICERKEIGVLFEYIGIARRLDRQQIEFFMTTLMRMCRTLTNRNLAVQHLCFVHRREVTTELSAFFGGDIRFGADVDEAIFLLSIRDLPIVSSDPYLNRLLVKYFEEALAQRKIRRSSFETRIENAIAVLLPHGKAQTYEVARKLGVSQRTLRRRLAAEGLTFTGLLRRLRSDLAKRHLADKHLSISKISWLLGYQGASSFTNAFKRWNGRSPRAARRDVAAEPGSSRRTSENQDTLRSNRRR